MLRFVLQLAVGLWILNSCVLGQEDSKETDQKNNQRKNSQKILPDEDVRDFKFQGEYEGALEPNEKTLGIQVIAMGKGRFQLVAFEGGLPGDGFSGKMPIKIRPSGQFDSAENCVKVIACQLGDLTIKNGILNIATIDNSKYGQLKKVIRKSKTLGDPPPRDAVVLFDGSTVVGWRNGILDESSFTLDDGTGERRNSSERYLMQGTTSIEQFGDHQLHLEFRLPFMPNAKGQARGNSGMYIQSRFEIQMLDSFGLDGKHNECGGIYSVKDPDLNMCYPPMSWQTYDVKFTAARFDDNGELKSSARVTVKHNGVVIHNDVELPNRKTTAAPVNFGPEQGPLYLQDHRNQVRYRNIWAIKSRPK